MIGDIAKLSPIISVSFSHFAGAGYIIVIRDQAQRKNLKWVIVRSLLSLLFGFLAAFVAS
jgi:hypothetical protein